MWWSGKGVEDSPTYKTEASFLKELLPNGSLWVGVRAYRRVWQPREMYQRAEGINKVQLWG